MCVVTTFYYDWMTKSIWCVFNHVYCFPNKKVYFELFLPCFLNFLVGNLLGVLLRYLVLILV